MVKKTSFAASVDESKGVITGILMELLHDSVNMVAIDGYRMAITRENMINKEEKNVILPMNFFRGCWKWPSGTEKIVKWDMNR